MKLRLRSLESKETLKIQVPNPCSLQQLKHTVSLAISASSSSSLHLSLNRKDEIRASSPDDSLQSIGIAAGDLVFYTLNPNSLSRQTDGSDSLNAPSMQQDPSPPIPDVAEAEAMEIDDGSVQAAVRSDSEPLFLKRVLREAAIGNDVSDFKLLILAVHAVVLESGFVRADMAVGCHNLRDAVVPSGLSSVISLRYTLPEILAKGSSQTVNLKFLKLGHMVNVCGALSNGSRLHMVDLNRSKFAPPLKLLLANSESKVGDDQFRNGNVVFELWKILKDGLALPLLIDVCEKAGFNLPPCLMRLPMELKVMILEKLPGVDLAKAACSCSELRYLASNNELWEKKFKEEFGSKGIGVKSFKDLFARNWITKKQVEQQPSRALQPRFFPFGRHPIPFGGNPNPFGGNPGPFGGIPGPFGGIPIPFGGNPSPFGGNPSPFGVPGILGGDHDLQPDFGLTLPGSSRRRNFLPPCDLGGFNI